MTKIDLKKEFPLEFNSESLTSPLSIYHNKIIQTFTALPRHEPLCELIVRIAALILAPLAYPILGILYLVGKSTESPSHLSDGKKLKIQIEELRATGKIDWRELALPLIRHSRKNQPAKELQRLRDAEALDPLSEKMLDASLSRVSIETGYISSSRRDQIKVLFAQAIELKKLYQDTHHVFLHGQASPRLGITHLVKELHRIHHPELNLHQFKFLRAPCSTAEPGVLESLSRFLSAITLKKGVASYRERWFQALTLSDHDPKVREELLSSDGFFFNYSRYESAMHFLSNNINILSDYSSIEKVAKSAIAHFYPALSDELLSLYSKKITQSISSKEFPCGNLFVLCIPKESSRNVHYRAHPFGKVCNCHPREKDEKILEKLQNGVLDAETKCNSFLAPVVPQFRVYLPGIQPGNNQKIFLLSPLSHPDRKEIKSTIRTVIQQLHTLFTKNSYTFGKPAHSL